MTTQQCQVRIRSRDPWDVGHHCSRRAVVTGKDGKGYCKLHDPERKERRRKALTCIYGEAYGEKCGHPVVEVGRFGWGRCAEHTVARLAYTKRLHDAAPELLDALKRTLAALESPEAQHVRTFTAERETANALIARVGEP